MWRRASWHRWAQYAVLLCGLCGDVFAGCLFMSAGVPSEVTWPPPPPQWLPRSPWPPGPQASAVIQASGDARGPVRGDGGGGAPACRLSQAAVWLHMTGAAASVIATLWTRRGGQTGSGGSPGDCLQAFWCPEEAEGQQALSPDTDPREGGKGTPGAAV